MVTGADLHLMHTQGGGILGSAMAMAEIVAIVRRGYPDTNHTGNGVPFPRRSKALTAMSRQGSEFPPLD